MKSMSEEILEIKLPTNYSNDDLKSAIRNLTNLSEFDFKIDLKSLDARKKDNIHWNIRVIVYPKGTGHHSSIAHESLVIPKVKSGKKVSIIGSGPAGFFAGYVLSLSGFEVSIFEKGPETEQRYQDVRKFEHSGSFTSSSNYAHGEGGAGTFSDGKLTSRTKNISIEKRFVFETYVAGGAPEEILYLAKPHIGSDNLRKVIPALREMFRKTGGNIYFNEAIIDLEIWKNKCISVSSNQQKRNTDILIIAPGHSSFETYRLMMKLGIEFEPKPFAIGVRVEHPQSVINRSQWGIESLPGIKAADYKLTFTSTSNRPVYSFCMCPGGFVVPANPEPHMSVVNGVSNYLRNSSWANSGIVAGLSIPEILSKQVNALQCLEYVEFLEEGIFNFKSNYDIPANTIKCFINDRICTNFPKTSFPFKIYPSDFGGFLALPIIEALREGMIDFSKKIKGFDQGIMMGLESKTSAPVRVLRDDQGHCKGFSNIYMAGEGSGFSGGIVSSAVDGIRIAQKIIASNL